MEEVLLELGLSDKEAALYLQLLEVPHQTANQLADAADIKRTNVYRLLDNLVELGLVRFDENPVRKYTTTSPQALQQLVKDRQQQIKQAASSLATAMPDFRSQYSLSLDKPGVFYMSGPEGFERSLLDAVRSKTEILLIASDDVPDDEATLKRFRELLHERKKMGVKTRALFHHCGYEQRIKKEFEERGMEIRFIGSTPFKGEVAIYEDNAVFGVYDPSIVLTHITNVHIAETMRTLFELLWEKADRLE
jgi:sugar-specific transcriptional regulator TrmB